MADYGDLDTSAVTVRMPGGALVQIDSTRQTGYGYDGALDHFVDALRNGRTAGPDLAEALKAQAIAEAASKSLVTGQLQTAAYPRTDLQIQQN